MYKKIKKLKTHHQFIYSVVIAISLICLWRGTWGLLDTYLFPNNLLLSYFLSFLLGLLVFGITHKKLS